jgi:hypothetical protein
MYQRRGTTATFSIIAAIGSYFLTFSGHPILGLITGIVSLPLGIIGLVIAASPRVSGGIISIFAILLGAGAVVVGALGVFGVIIF